MMPRPGRLRSLGLVVFAAALAPFAAVRCGGGELGTTAPHSAFARPPPGPLGARAVRIVPGSSPPPLPGGFVYQSGQLGSPWRQRPLQQVRGEDPGVAVMTDGRVLVAGGTSVPDSTADA